MKIRPEIRQIGTAFGLSAICVMGTMLVFQHQEIGRLQRFTRLQAGVLQTQQQISSTAIRHLELIRRYAIPYRYLEVLAAASTQHQLDLEFMVGLMRVESHYDPNAQSNKSAYGLMQVQFDTAHEIDPSLQSFWQLFDPERNIQLGAAYFRNLLDRYEGDYRMAALAYNRGPTRLDVELLENGFPPDGYFRKILAAGIVN